jgi:molecular chaperone Hsp33
MGAQGRLMAADRAQELNLPEDNLVLPFQTDRAGVIGRVVRLGSTVDDVLRRHDYPEPVSEILGQAVALTAMLGAALKFDGKLILQTTTDGAVDLMVADYRAPGAVRAYARFSSDRLDAEDEVAASLLGRGHLAMTIDRGPETERYQGVVPLEGGSMSEAAHAYFHQSEQLPTFVRLVVAKHFGEPEGGGPRRWSWRAGGIMIQKLTREGGIEPEGGPEIAEESEDWNRARLLAQTVEDHELLDPLLAPERLLFRLFHEEGVRTHPAQKLETYCSCSREIVESMLCRFSDEDLDDMTVDGEVEVTCEFCNRAYSFDPDALTRS